MKTMRRFSALSMMRKCMPHFISGNGKLGDFHMGMRIGDWAGAVIREEIGAVMQ
jgi:hypothetical protein